MRRLAIKIQLCFILVLMQITRSYAQVNTDDYHPFVVEGKMWNCSWCEWDKKSFSSSIHSYSYLIQGDTIIGNTEWKRVFVCDKATYNDESWHYCLAVREQDKRVYKIDKGNTDATLIYDFDLPINSIIDYGEQKVALSPYYTINTHIKLHWGRKSGIISYEGSILNRYDAAVLLVYEGEDSNESLPGFCVVEGVGARSDPFMPQFWICNWVEGTTVERGESEFMSCYENGVCITTDDAIEGSFETGWSAFTTEEGINLFCQTLPPGVVMIAGLKKEEDTILEKLTIPGAIPKYPNYPTVVREYFLDNVKIRNIILKEGVSGVQPYAFRNCSYLETLTLPSTINDYSGMESNAFAQCDNIKQIYSDWAAPTVIPDDVFSEQVYNHAILYVPLGTLSIYQTTSGWNQFKNIEEFIPTSFNPIVSEAKFWQLYDSDESTFSSTTTWKTVAIDGKDYQQILHFNGKTVPDTLYFRGDNTRIYRYDANSQTEYTAYDFGLSFGDKFTGNDGVKMTVDKTWYENVNGRSLKHLHLVNKDNPQMQDTWVEGYGSIYTGLLNPTDWQDGVVQQHLLFDSSGYINIINTDNLKTCLLEKEKIGGQIFDGNQPEKVISYSFDSNNLCLDGEMYLPASPCYAVCEVIGNTIDINLITIDDGAESSFTYKVHAVFPGFEAGTYTLTQNGKDPQTIVCQPTSVNSIKAESNNTPIFGLTGRRLNSIPEKGMYIQDGKKWLRK